MKGSQCYFIIYIKLLIETTQLPSKSSLLFDLHSILVTLIPHILFCSCSTFQVSSILAKRKEELYKQKLSIQCLYPVKEKHKNSGS